MINFAHRGFKGVYPENTMLAFKKAYEAGATGIEFDVHLTRDNELVIIHDELLDRTTDGKGLVCEKTLADLQKLNASKLYSNCEVQAIPSLREYFDFVKDTDLITNIELKTSIITYKNIEQLTYDLAKEYGLLEKIIISSFNHNSLVRMKEIDENVECGVLESSRLYKPWKYIKEMGMEYFHPMNFAVTDEVVDKCRGNGIGINIWFELADYEASQYLKYNPNGLITDHPDRVNEMISK